MGKTILPDLASGEEKGEKATAIKHGERRWLRKSLHRRHA